MTTSLITSAQVADNADRINFLPRMQVVVRGVSNRVFLEGVSSKDEVTEKLAARGYVVTREWVGNETFIARAA